MTKERRLAIQMWNEVKERLPYWYVVDKSNLATELKLFKMHFCHTHDLKWPFNCWFCAYTRGVCARCPLHSCDHTDPSTAWARIVTEKSSLGTRLVACDEIIKVLGGNSNE